MACRGRYTGGLRAGGFTLLELMVAMSILVTVLAICYQLLGSTLQASERIDRRTRPDKIGQGIMSLLRRDLLGAVWRHLGDQVFVGEDRGDGESARDEIHFLTTAPPLYAAERDLGYVLWTGVTSVSYILRPSTTADRCFTLFRREGIDWSAGTDPFQTGTYFEIYDKVKYLDFRFFDGTRWLTQWDSSLRYEQYRNDMKAAIEELVNSVTKIPTNVADKNSTTGAKGKQALEALRAPGIRSRGRGSLDRLEAGAQQPETLLPLPDWAVPRAVHVELGIVVGSERGIYRSGVEANAPERIYKYSATVIIPSAIAVRLTADVGRFAGQVPVPLAAGAGAGAAGTPKQGAVQPAGGPSGPSAAPGRFPARLRLQKPIRGLIQAAPSRR